MAHRGRILVLSSSERRPWPGLTPVDSAQEIRLDPSPRAHMQIHIHTKQWYKRMIAKYEKQIELWLN